MSSLKRRSLLFLMVMFVLIAIPMSFAADAGNDTAADVVGVESSDVDTLSVDEVDDVVQSSDDVDDVVQYTDDTDVLGTNLDITLDSADITMEEGGSATLSGKLTYNKWYTYKDNPGEIVCTYTDGNGASQTKSVMTSQGLFSFDLSGFTGLTASGSPYTLTLTGNDPYGNLEWAGYEFSGPVTATVTVTGGTGPSYDYTSTPDPDEVSDYVLGTNQNIAVTVVSDYLSDLEGFGSMFAWVNGETANDRVLLNGIDAGASSFTVNLATLSSKMVEGTNTITFHPSTSLIEEVTYDENYYFAPLTVVASAPAPSYDYTSTPDPAEVNDYVLGESKIITVTVDSDYINDITGDYMYAWVNGEGANNRVLLNGIPYYSASFTVDLADLSSKMVEGTNTITFHPTPSYIEEQSWSYDHNFVPLTVVASEPAAPSYDYTSTPSPVQVSDYILGDSKVITVAVDSDYLEDLQDLQCSMFAWVNGEGVNDRVLLNGISGAAQSFTVDLADLSSKLVEGTNTITFHPTTQAIEEVTYDDNYYFVPLTVVASAPVVPSYDYISTPDPAEVSDYVIGDSKIITVTVDTEYAYDLDDLQCSMFAWVNGEGVNDRILLNGISGGATSFTVDLADLSSKLVEGTNTITFHPTTQAIEEVTYDDNYYFVPLTVVASGPALPDYSVTITTPETAFVDHAKGDDSFKVFVKTTYDYNTMSALDNSKMYAYINNSTVGVIVKSSFNTEVRGSALTFAFNLTQFDEYFTDGINTIVFHPDESYYSLAGISTYYYQPLTVNVTTPIVEVELSADDLVMDYKDGSAWTVTLTDGTNPIEGAVVKVGILGKTYSLTTAADGTVSLPVNVAPGSYDVNATFEGDETYDSAFVSATVTVGKAVSTLTAEDLTMAYKNGSWIVTLTGAEGAIPKAAIKFGILGKVYTIKTDANGVAALAINLAPDTYEVNATFEGNAKHESAFVSATVTVEKATATLTAEDLTMSYKDGSAYTVTLTDANGAAVAGTTVKFTLGTKSYNIKTDENGVAALPINLNIGEYPISVVVDDAKYTSEEATHTITVTDYDAVLVANDINMTYQDGTNYEVQLTTADGTPIAVANLVVKITLLGKTYNIKTDAEGIAKLPINLKAGSYTVTAEYNGAEITNAIVVNKA